MLAACVCGTAGALVTMPLWILASAGAVLCGLAWWKSKRPPLAGALLGAALGFGLPRVPPPVSGPVLTHAVETSSSGDLLLVLDQLDADPHSVIGRQVLVSGNWHRAGPLAPASISRTITSCCAADSVAVGFDVYPAKQLSANSGDWVRVRGKVSETLRDGEVRYGLVGASASFAKAARTSAAWHATDTFGQTLRTTPSGSIRNVERATPRDVRP